MTDSFLFLGITLMKNFNGFKNTATELYCAQAMKSFCPLTFQLGINNFTGINAFCRTFIMHFFPFYRISLSFFPHNVIFLTLCNLLKYHSSLYCNFNITSARIILFYLILFRFVIKTKQVFSFKFNLFCFSERIQRLFFSSIL